MALKNTYSTDIRIDLTKRGYEVDREAVNILIEMAKHTFQVPLEELVNSINNDIASCGNVEEILRNMKRITIELESSLYLTAFKDKMTETFGEEDLHRVA